MPSSPDPGHAATLIALDEAEWTTASIPDGQPDVRIAPLHALGDVRTVLVEFPAGWARPVAGHYDAAEEALFLRGGLTIGDDEYEVATYAWFPPKAHRDVSAAPTGALAVARFVGRYLWHPGRADDDPGPAVRHVLTPPDEDDGIVVLRGGSDHRTVLAARPELVQGPVELVSIAARTWAWVPRGQEIPNLPGPLLCWQSTAGGG